MNLYRSLLFALLWYRLNAFVVPIPTLTSTDRRAVSNDSPQSRLEGNQVNPSMNDILVMDEMISKLLHASKSDLPQVVQQAYRVISSPKFFLRIAQRQDASNPIQAKALSNLAQDLTRTLAEVRSVVHGQQEERVMCIQNILKAAAEPETGEFLVPLLPSQVEGMRQIMLQQRPWDETFLQTVDSWMHKCQQDGLDGMFSILQKVLQLYSEIVILENTTIPATPAGKVFRCLLEMDPDHWDPEIRRARKDGLSSAALMAEIRSAMMGVLNLENGSLAQRIQAECLRDLLSRVQKSL